MRSWLLLILVIWLASEAKAGGPDQVISVQIDLASFDDFSREVYRLSGVKVYYRPEWVEDVQVSLHADSITVMEAVKHALKGSDLNASPWHDHIVLIPGSTLLQALPEFRPVVTAEAERAEEPPELTAAEERYLTGRKPEAVRTIRIGSAGMQTGSGPASVLGRLLDEETGEPVYNATIYVEETRSGAVSDVNGFFTLLLRPGKYNVVIDFLGYEKTKYLLEILSDGSFSVNMKRTVYQIDELVVHGDRQSSIIRKDPGLDKIAVRNIKELPMMMGELDVLKVSGTLPGILSMGEGTAGLNVRGGSADQNAFYLNKIPIYNTAHMFGFFPAFNADLIKDFSVYKGHIPANFGGRLSSVFNVIARQGNRKQFTAHGGVSPTAANLVVEGPLKKDAASFLLSGRSTFSDWVLKRIQDPDIRASSAGFYDLSGGLNYDTKKTQMSLFGYHSNDRFAFSDITDYSYSNSGVSLSISHNLSRTVRGEFSLTAARYAFNTIDKQEVSSAYEHNYRMDDYALRADFTHGLSEAHTLEYGLAFVLYRLDRGDVMPYGLQSLRTGVDLGNEQGLESACYITDSYDITTWLGLTAGLRFALFTPLGPQKVFTYAPELPADPRYIIDSTSYSRGQPIKWYPQPDLRLAVIFTTDENGTVKLAFNQMHQNLFMLNNTLSVAPNSQWKLADYHLEPARSNLLSAGVFRTLPRMGLEISVEVYYKKTSNYPEFRDGANFLESPQAETVVLQGDQQAYGIEFFLKRSSRRLEGWLSYTYSRSLIQVSGDRPWNSINEGEAYPSNFDIPHVLNMVLNYHFSRRVTFSTVLTYQSGKPITYPVSVYYVDGVPYFDYSKRNAYRIPDYFRMDISLTIEGSLRRRKFLHSSVNLSVYNLLGRENPYAVYFTAKNGRILSYQYAVIGVPIFTATWIFKLGNYASN